MSWCSWHTYGYGVKVSDLENVSMRRVVEFIQKAPDYAVEFNNWLSDYEIEELTLENLCEFDEDYRKYGKTN